VDYQMPELDGLRTIELLRQGGAFDEQGKVILVSAYGDDISEQTIEQGNIHGLISKPVSQSRLFDTLMAIMGEDLRPARISNDPISSLTSKLRKLGNLRFLLVEDNEINRQVAHELLQDEGIQVDEAVDGIQAIAAINQAAKEMLPYDLVFMDLQMPKMDGYTAVEEIRKDSAFKDLPIIAMTADAMSGVEEQVYRSGMDGYITKPIVIEELFRTILQLLDPSGRQGLEEISAILEQDDHLESGAADLEQHQEFGSDLLPKLSGVDRAKAIRRLRGNYQLYQRLLKSFYASYQDFSNTYMALSNEDQRKRKIREIHTLKGILGTLGHQDLQSKAASLNEALISETGTSSQSVLEEQILTGVADFIAELEPWVQGHDDDTHVEASSGAPPVREKPINTKDTLVAELRTLQGLISANDSSALLKARNLQTRLKESSEMKAQRELLHQVCDYLENFDFDQANQRLTELIGL
jgi:CheY-like chemotaxis protein